MNILFLTLLDFDSIEEYGIYTDLMRAFVCENHKVDIVSPIEKHKSGTTRLISNDKYRILKVKIGNIQKNSILEKGISTLTVEKKFLKAIKKYFPDISFDLIVYSTPPITFEKVVAYIKKRDNAKSYLLLKDIFPQNAVDLGILSTKGLKSPIYKYFRKREKGLYLVSDRIGCMSQANVDYLLTHNSEILKKNVDICPNSLEIRNVEISEEQRDSLRDKFYIPRGKVVFVYGGNLGKPQDVSFIIQCLKTQEKNDKTFFLIIGQGTEYWKLEEYIKKCKPTNVKLIRHLPRDEYDEIVASCDVGLIFLDHRFTIPNFPSRLLGYLQAGLPVLACTDSVTDIGKIIVEGGFGWWCASSNPENFMEIVEKILKKWPPSDKNKMARKYLRDFYDVNIACRIVLQQKRDHAVLRGWDL